MIQNGPEIKAQEKLIRVSLESAHVTSQRFSYLLPTFKSGFRCSRNGGPLVIWIISLYL